MFSIAILNEHRHLTQGKEILLTNANYHQKMLEYGVRQTLKIKMNSSNIISILVILKATICF